MRQAAALDIGWRAVRISQVRPDGFVAFDFAIGEPEIFVEMILRQDDFVAFCREQSVVEFMPAQAGASSGDLEWRLRDAALDVSKRAAASITSSRTN